MKILFITTRFAPHVGGVEQVVQNLANRVAKKDDVRVLTSLIMPKPSFKDVKSFFRISKPEESFDNYKVKRIWLNLPRSFVGYLLILMRFPLAIIELVKYIKAFNPDIINYHFPDDSSLYLLIASFFVKKPIVLSIHGNDLQLFAKKFPYKFITPIIVKMAKVVVVNSRYMQDEFIKDFPSEDNKVVIINNGVDLDIIKNTKPKKFFKENYIFYIGRFVYKKGVDVLIKAFKKADLKNYKLLMEGYGETWDEINSLVELLDLKDKVVLTKGSLSETQKIAFMKGANIGVMPSRIEPFGIVAIELMAAGLPVIASETGGLKDLIKNDYNGVFFKNGDVDSLADVLIELTQDSKKQVVLSRNGLQSASKYSWDSITRQYLVLFDKKYGN